MTDAPVCLLPNQGQVPASQAGVLLPTVPHATDLPTMLQAVNALRQVFNIILGPTPQMFRNNMAPTLTGPGLPPLAPRTGGAGGGTMSILRIVPGPAGKDGKDGKTKPITFRETSRTKEKVKIVSEDDEDLWIIVERIKKIEFKDDKTGSRLVWERYGG